MGSIRASAELPVLDRLRQVPECRVAQGPLAHLIIDRDDEHSP